MGSGGPIIPSTRFGHGLAWSKTNQKTGQKYIWSTRFQVRPARSDRMSSLRLNAVPSMLHRLACSI